MPSSESGVVVAKQATAAKGNRKAGRLASALRALAVVGMASWLGACAVPPAVSVASYVGDGILLLSTGKSSTDIGLSLATGRDCAAFRLLTDEHICQDNALARAEPIPAEVLRDDVAAGAARRPLDGPARAALAARVTENAFQPLAAGERTQPRSGLVMASLPPLALHDAPAVVQPVASFARLAPPPPRPPIVAAALNKPATSKVVVKAKAQGKAVVVAKGPAKKKARLTAAKKKAKLAAGKKKGKLVSAKKRSKVASAKKKAKIAAAKKGRGKVAAAKKRNRVIASKTKGAGAAPPAAVKTFTIASLAPLLVPAPVGALASAAPGPGVFLWAAKPPPPSMGTSSQWTAAPSGVSNQMAALARP